MYASWIAHLISVLMQCGKKGFREEKNMSSSREQKKLQRTENCGWLVCAAIVDCSQNVSSSREQKKLHKSGNRIAVTCC